MFKEGGHFPVIPVADTERPNLHGCHWGTTGTKMNEKITTYSLQITLTMQHSDNLCTMNYENYKKSIDQPS